MKELMLQQQQDATCGRSLSSNFVPMSLENKILAQTSIWTPPPPPPPPLSSSSSFAAQPSSCSALQPTSLSSTSSSLFSSSSSLTSPLLSTQNKLLTSDSPRLSFSLTSSVAYKPLLSKRSRLTQPTSLLCTDLGGDEAREEISEVMQSCFEETSMLSEEDDVSPEDEDEEVDDLVDLTVETLNLETEFVDNNELEQTTIGQDEFTEFDVGNEKLEEELKNKKYLLLNEVCCSLVNKNVAPGQKEWDTEKSVWTRIRNLAKDISDHDPQFILKVAVYTRQELNIRITANFLLALAASQPSTKPHVRRYFCAAVQLPSDWLEVVRLYSSCFSRSLPMCLKKAMVDKFKQFNEYQLAKYNTRKHRCKHNRNRHMKKKPSEMQLNEWANMLRTDTLVLKKFMQMQDKKKVVVDKKQSEFSIKKMIKRLHIKEPAEHVMAILGKKYPADMKTFTRSGIKGSWDREKAGKRMKLKEPETWERLLSREGNKAATWEKLIDGKSLPFMAMLRNLRNMISQGVSEAHHKKILDRLTNKKAVIQSRQFPFRFLAAYKVIMELYALASTSQQQVPPMKGVLVEILKKIPKSRRYKGLDWESNRKRTRLTLAVPFICRLYRLKKALILKAHQKLYSVALLDRYRKALETAVQISCRYNVPPLPGRSVILLSSYMGYDGTWDNKQDFCVPPDPNADPNPDSNPDPNSDPNPDPNPDPEAEKEKQGKKSDADKLSPSLLDVASLLSMMISSSAEDCQLYVVDDYAGDEIKLTSDNLLENARNIKKQIEDYRERSCDDRDNHCLSKIFGKKNKVDNIIMFTNSWMPSQVQFSVNLYRKEVNNNALMVNIFLCGEDRGSDEAPLDKNCVTLSGFSEQILRFVAERGSSRLLDHVEHLDKLYNVPPPPGDKDPQTSNGVVSIPASPKMRWRGVRVFISSTFRDMHAERDILVRSVFPELRRRAAQHRLHLQEVELRWGVTEEESGRATELCLSEVCRSQMMVAILGERYGQVPPRLTLPDLPQYRWLSSAPADLSVTEMEIRQFQALFPETLQQRMLCYFRDPNISRSVPVAWRSDFVPESKEAESKMSALKNQIRATDVKVTENYTCEWGGVVDGKPYLKNLEDFGKAVLDDLWAAVVKQFVEEDEETEATVDVTEQETHQGALQRQFFGRAKLLSGAVEMVEQVQTKGGLMVVEGGAGDGKTVFMAALADALRTGAKSRRNLVCDVVSYSTAASQSSRSVFNLLRCFVRWSRKMKDAEDESALPHSYKDLLSEFRSSLDDHTKRNKPLVLLVDGVDAVRDDGGRLSSDWIPQQLPQGVCLVVSITSNAALLQTLVKNRSSVLFTLAQLTVPDRKEIVQKELDTFGKKLSDSAFNNQLQTLIMKKGAVSPLYLHLACEDLRSFSSFDQLKENLQDLPQSLSQLVQRSLDRLCSQHRGMLGLRWTLAALAISPTGLKERDLLCLLNTCNDLSARDRKTSWQEVLHLSRKPKGRVPMATFTRLVQGLQSLIGPSRCRRTDDSLALTNPEVKRAFEDFLLPAASDRTRAHLVLAAHLWAMADPQGTDTFLYCEANSVMHLPHSLIQSGQLEALHSLLSSYYFLYANVRHGLLHHLLETYDTYNETHKSASLSGRLQDCQSFLQRHAALLSSWPPLFVQQAFNEPPQTPAHIWAQSLVGNGGVKVIEWLNNKDQTLEENSELVSTFSSEPSCVVVSPDGEMMAVGTGQGTLHVFNTQTGQEVKSLVSSCDGVSSCVFLKDGRLVTTSYDGRIEIWDVENGCRTALIQGHTNVITGSDISSDSKHLATVSLDFMLKVWSSSKGHEVASFPSSSPLNCVTFDPEGHLLAAGCWNGDVVVWNWLQNQTHTRLSGHGRSVRSLSFSSSSSSSILCSGSISGEVRVWSLPSSTCVGCFQAHHGATEVLTFLDDGAMLLSAGADHMLQLWSGGLGRGVAVLKSDDCEEEPPQKKRRSVNSVPAALCVAVNGDYAAVGYHGKGIKYFNLDSGEMVWASGDSDTSVLCLAWVVLNADQTEPAPLLVSGGSDRRLRIWKREEGEKGTMSGLKNVRMLAAQQGAILALAQNSTYLATASDDCSVALWLLNDLEDDSCNEPHALLRNHNGGVTCLTFSPDGGRLLSGGKDQALMVWDMSSSPPVLSKSLPHSHRDWITGCVWTPDCVISSSNDGRLCLWDLDAGKSLREISWRSPLTSVCCLDQYVMAGCAEGALHMWNWKTNTEICHIAAHKQRLHHISLLSNTDKKTDVNAEEMTVFTASDDGEVKIWKPLQMEHFSTFQGHSGAIHAVVGKRGASEFLTVSEDCSLRCWTLTKKSPVCLSGPVAALCFSEEEDDLCLVGYEAGFLEVWQHGAVVGHKQASDSTIRAICTMPHNQFAVSYHNCLIDVWKLVWNEQRSFASLVKVATHTVTNPVIYLLYCCVLIGVSENGNISDITTKDKERWESTVTDWEQLNHVLGLIRNDQKSMWLFGEVNGKISIGFIFILGPTTNLHSAFGSGNIKCDEDEEEKKRNHITALTMDKEFLVCGDVKGNMWFNHPPEMSSWSRKKPVHGDRVSVLRLTDSTIISASYDRTVKLWDRGTKKQVGMFVCGGPVLVLEVNPLKPTELVCGDAQGKLYFLSWKE